LKDIFVDGVNASFVEGAYWERPRALSNFLIHRPSISTGLDAIKLRPSYRSATLLLDPKVVSREISVNAVGSALKLLCMDVPIEDMIIDELLAFYFAGSQTTAVSVSNLILNSI